MKCHKINKIFNVYSNQVLKFKVFQPIQSNIVYAFKSLYIFLIELLEVFTLFSGV